MVLVPQKPDDVANLLAKCDELASILKELRASMRDPGPLSVELDGVKPVSALDYLIDWATRAKKKHRSLQHKEQAAAKRAEVEARRRALEAKRNALANGRAKNQSKKSK